MECKEVIKFLVASPLPLSSRKLRPDSQESNKRCISGTPQLQQSRDQLHVSHFHNVVLILQSALHEILEWLGYNETTRFALR